MLCQEKDYGSCCKHYWEIFKEAVKTILKDMLTVVVNATTHAEENIANVVMVLEYDEVQGMRHEKRC